MTSTASAAIFISYRTADGADKATALARDLGQQFGAERVFLDKDDLHAGSAWRRVIESRIGTRPVVLALLTPQYICARDSNGSRRIDHADDPVRSELAAALAAGVHIVPLLCDGVSGLPPADDLPAELKSLAELTWRRLRTFDWHHDVARLVNDLRALGVQDAAAAGAKKDRRSLALAACGIALVVVGGMAGFNARQQRSAHDVGIAGEWVAAFDGPPTGASATSASAAASKPVLAGPWLRLRVKPTETGFAAASAPVVVATDPAWAAFNENWRSITGTEPPRMVYRFNGALRNDVPGEPPVFEAELKVEPETGGEAVDGGAFRGQLVDGGQTIKGWIRLNSGQAEHAMTWRRDGT
jgi:TIR domain